MHINQLQVLYDDNHLIAVNKPSGILVQGDKTGDIPLSEVVREWIREKYNKPGNVFTGVIHRLDRPVSGVVLFARTSKGLERMNKMFKERSVKKVYWAISDRKPPKTQDKLVDYIRKKSSKNIVDLKSSGSPKEKGILEYRLMGAVNHNYLLEVTPETGKPHQIRAQIAGAGCPLIGDLKYGSKGTTEDKSILLHARRLEFIHPVKKTPVKITAPLPSGAEWDKFSNFNE